MRVYGCSAGVLLREPAGGYPCLNLPADRVQMIKSSNSKDRLANPLRISGSPGCRRPGPPRDLVTERLAIRDALAWRTSRVDHGLQVGVLKQPATGACKAPAPRRKPEKRLKRHQRPRG